MAGPWEDFKEEGPWSEFQSDRDKRVASITASNPAEYDPSSAAFQKRYGAKGSLPGRVASALGRPLVQAIVAPATTLGDFAVGADQWVNYGIDKLTGRKPTPIGPLPSQQFRESLDSITFSPQGTSEKVAEAINTAILGAAMPLPTTESKVPANFRPSGAGMRQEAMREASKAGYVAPPSSINPTAGNRVLEGLSGKLKLGQMAAERNQGVTDQLSALALGERSGAAVTPGAIRAIRSEAGAAGYAPLRNIGVVATDDAYQQALDAITAGAKGAEKSFPGIRPVSPIDDTVAALRQAKFDAGDGLDAISHLRELADDAYSSGQKVLGKQYKSAAKALEDVIERDLTSRGKDGERLLSAFRSARELIAKTYTASKAAVGESGQFNAASYGNQLAKGAPLSGEQRTIGNFAQSFGRYVKKPTGDTVPQFSPLDVYGSAMASGASGSPLPFLYPLSRAGLREYLLSPAAQKKAMEAAATAERSRLGITGAIPSIGLFPTEK